jgi:hypothetical protein
MIRKRRRTSALLGVLFLTCVPVLLLQSRLFAVRTVAVEGVPRDQAAQLQSLCRTLEGRNLLNLELADATRALAPAGWVRDLRIRKVLPSRLEITVEARRPVAVFVGGGGEALVDAAGTLYCGPSLEGPCLALTGDARNPAVRRLAAFLAGTEGLERRLAGVHIAPDGEVRFLDRLGHWLTVDLDTAAECLPLFETLLEECPGYASAGAVDIRRPGRFIITG